MNTCSHPFVVLSAPSGAGKSTIARKLIQRNTNLKISVSATTRPKRPLETDGVDYYFLSEEEFKKEISAGNFLEYENVHGFLYGTLRPVVDRVVEEGYQVVFDIDVKGALTIKNICPEAILIFIKPPSLDELRRRLKNRRSESEEAMAKRLGRIEYEYEQAEKFDYVVINDDLEHAVEEIEMIIIDKK
jgi:guanylate kinase